MNELIAKILSEGFKEIITSEPVLGGLTRPLSIRYSSVDGVVIETITYPPDTAMERHWGAIESINYTLQTALDVEKAEMFTHREYGKDIISNLLYELKQQSLTVLQKATLFNDVRLVVILLLAGELNIAKNAAENLPTTTLYNNARKNWLVNRIQTEIDKL